MAKLSRRLQKTNKDQYILTIPKQLVDLLGWKEKNRIEFGFEDGKITLRRDVQKISRRKKRKK